METVRSIEAMANAIGWRRSNRQIGLVSTMGNLHDGHVALIKACTEEADISVVSVYVNPMQFDDDEAFSRYPRNLDADKARLADLGVDYLFAPRDEEMFPSGTRDLTTVRLPRLAIELHGIDGDPCQRLHRVLPLLRFSTDAGRKCSGDRLRQQRSSL